MEQQLEAKQSSHDPLEPLKTFYLGLAKLSPENSQWTRLLMRELLDSNTRSERADNWYLRAFLQRLVIMMRSVDTLQNLSDKEVLLIAYQMLGAINYYLVSLHAKSYFWWKNVWKDKAMFHAKFSASQWSKNKFI